ncbi:hypothetical protein [Streptomyces pseudogriseolus]|uniref:hypothetical protein n=1 Tax=Streptomyces pseudogriseolus TaxID=36817 RepID=UPI003FA294AB
MPPVLVDIEIRARQVPPAVVNNCCRESSIKPHSQGRDTILGTAYSDHDLVVFLEAAGIHDPDGILDDERRIEWRGGPAHQWSTA